MNSVMKLMTIAILALGIASCGRHVAKSMNDTTHQAPKTDNNMSDNPINSVDLSKVPEVKDLKPGDLNSGNSSTQQAGSTTK